MAFKVTWNGYESFVGSGLSFEPGETRYFKSREHIPTELLMDHRFSAEAVPYEEAFPPEVVDPDAYEADADPRSRGTVPRFTEVPLPEDEH